MKKSKLLIVLSITLIVLFSCATAKTESVKAELKSVSLDVDPALYTERTVSIEANDRITIGILTMPTNVKKDIPAVVMLHGTGTQKDEAGNAYYYAAKIFAENGIASLRIDFPGSGDSPESYTIYSFRTAVEDAIAAMHYLQDIKGIGNIGILGWSQGGTDAILAAAADSDFESVVLWAGSLDLSAIATDEAYGIAKKQGYYERTFSWRDPLLMGLEWFENVRSTSIIDHVKDIDAPILAINGELDTVVPPSSGEVIAATSSNENSQQLIIPGADHTLNVFSEPNLDALALTIGATTDWFVKTL